MVKWLIRVIIVLVVSSAVIAGRGLFFYSSLYQAPAVKTLSYEQITAMATPLTTLLSDNYSDRYAKGKGKVLIDMAHSNFFTEGELNVLLLRLVSRGMTVNFFHEGDDLKKQLLKETGNSTEKKPALNDVFIEISPQKDFSKEDAETADNFTSQGGKILLIADPTREGNINSLSIKFGLIFEPDYLYNMQANETNFRNILITDFKENEVTKDLKKIALYTGGSISSADSGIAFVDENTFSSLIESRRKLSPIALTRESRVLAIYDLTFMTEPYNAILDNNQLISNIADWLAAR